MHLSARSGLSLFRIAPQGWELCNGQRLQAGFQNYQKLFAVIGFTYGGDYQNGFKLPNIQGSVLVGSGQLPNGDNYILGKPGGTLSVKVLDPQMPVHTHTFTGLITGEKAPEEGISVPTSNSYLSNVFGVPPRNMKRQRKFYSEAMPNTALNSQAVDAFPGQSQAHENMQPYLVINYCICWDGDWPDRP